MHMQRYRAWIVLGACLFAPACQQRNSPELGTSAAALNGSSHIRLVECPNGDVDGVARFCFDVPEGEDKFGWAAMADLEEDAGSLVFEMDLREDGAIVAIATRAGETRLVEGQPGWDSMLQETYLVANEPVCGDGLCQVEAGEYETSCMVDCAVLPTTEPAVTPTDASPPAALDADAIATCGDGRCDNDSSENATDCPIDCDMSISASADACGDVVCDVGAGESPWICPADCPGTCGDGALDPGELCDDGEANGVDAACTDTCMPFDWTSEGFETVDPWLDNAVLSVTIEGAEVGDLVTVTGDDDGLFADDEGPVQIPVNGSAQTVTIHVVPAAAGRCVRLYALGADDFTCEGTDTDVSCSFTAQAGQAVLATVSYDSCPDGTGGL
jgi:hypothetical protein